MNSDLSYPRTESTLKFLQSVDTHAMDRVETFRAVGEAGYDAPESDDSAEWRAVEVHIVIGDLPWTPPPPSLQPVPRPFLPLPGGERFTQWEVAAPGGAFIAVGVGGGFNIFFIRNPRRAEVRGYIQPVAGVGASLGLSGLRAAWNMVLQIVTGIQYSNPDYAVLTSSLPVTWKELEDCLVRISSAGAGIVKGASAAIITFTSRTVWQRGPHGQPWNVEAGDLFQFTAVGENWQLGVNASVVVGPLVRVG